MVGAKIKEIRTIKKFSLRKLARIAEMSNGTLSEIENGKSNPSVVTLQKIADAMDVNIEMFFKKDCYREENNTKDNDIEKEEELNSFTVKLVNELLKEGVIDNIEVIPDHITNMIVMALKADLKNKKGTK